MKKYLLLATIGSLFLASCNNEMDTVFSETEGGLQTRSMESGNMDFQIVNYEGESCVQFRNDSTYNAVLMKMQEMSESEIHLMFSGAGFVSQKQLMAQADQEQESIVDEYEKDPSQPFPYQQIEAFKQKYNDVFMFEPYDSTDFIVHYKLQLPAYSAYVNRDGFFLIGDSVVRPAVYTDLTEYFGNGITLYADEERSDKDNGDTNTAYAQIKPADSDRKKKLVKIKVTIKFGEELKFGNPAIPYKTIYLDYLSQKKKILWKKHGATIFLRLNVSGSGEHGAEAYIIQFGYQKAQMPFTVSAQIYDEEFDKFWGRVGEQAPKPAPFVGPFPRFSLSGDMEIWSNEIPEDKGGSAKVNLLENW